VPHWEQAVTIRDQHNEVVALWLYNEAEDAGVPITRAWCQRQIENIAGHAETCRCSSPCAQARGCSNREAYWIAMSWQRAAAKAKVLARR
jgi:hypothetical protein